MHSLAYYAILGSLIAGAAGALVLVAVAITHGPKRRDRSIRLVDTFALLCFAVSAALAIIGVMQQARATTLVVAARDVGAALERLEALETRLAQVELQQQVGLAAAPAAGEDRMARIERRIDAVEARTLPGAPRLPKARVAPTTGPVFPRAERVSGPPPAHPETPVRSLPTSGAPDGAAAPEAVIAPSPDPALTGPAGEQSTGSAIVAPPVVRAASAAVGPKKLTPNAFPGENSIVADDQAPGTASRRARR